MRTYGRIWDEFGQNPKWYVVETDINGYNDAVYLVTLQQILKQNLGESPFYANYGLPDEQSVVTQIAPDYYVAQTQQQMAPYFANLNIARAPSPDGITPTYAVSVLLQNGAARVLQIGPPGGSEFPG